MKHYVVFDAEGRIEQGLCLSESIPAPDGSIEVSDSHMIDLDFYVDVKKKTLIKKKPLDFHFLVDSLTVNFVGLPKNTFVILEGQTANVDAKGLEIEFDKPGTYEIYIDPPPQYKAETVEMTIG